MGILWLDLRHALRQLRHRPGFTAITVLTLALGIGATTAIFSVVYGVLLRPLPYPKPEQIVRLWEVDPAGHRMRFADPNFADVREQSRSLQGLAEYGSWLRSVTGGNAPTRSMTATVSGDFFSVMGGLQPFLGRTFESQDLLTSAPPVALVSYSYWKQYLGSPKDLSAAHLRIDDRAFTVVGVLPPDFRFSDSPEVDVVVPRELYPILPSRDAHNWNVIGRLRDGATLGAARAELSAIAQQLKSQHGAEIEMTGLAADSLREASTGYLRPALLLLFAASGLLLLIACVNVVNLMLAQASNRQREIAIRTALGAAQGRLVRQFFSESLLLALLGCLLGVVFASWGVNALLRIAPETLPRLADVSINPVVLLLALGITLVVAAALGIFSALYASGDAHELLHEASRRQSGSLRSRTFLRLLVSAQLATSLVLLVGAGLLGRSLLQVLSVDPGFRPAHVVAMNLVLPDAFATSAKAPRVQFLDELLARLRQVPGVQEVGGTSAMPLTDEISSNGTFALLNSSQLSSDWKDLIAQSAAGSLDSQPALLNRLTTFFDQLFRNPAATGDADYAVVSGGYFPALGVPLLRGRLFNERDTSAAPHAALISASLANVRWPNGNPLGQTLEFGNMDGDLRLLTVVGIVGDVREKSIESSPRPTVYVDYRQRPQATTHFTIVLQTAADAPAVIASAREVLRDLDPNVPPRFTTLPQIVSSAMDTRRFSLILVAVFASVALLLATAGLYGVTSYSVASRTRELGVRMALGATPRAVLRLVLGQGMGTTAVGVAIGIAGSLALAGLMRSLLFDISPFDPLTLASVTLLLAAVSLFACWIPAYRATRVDPLEALRYE
jgi:putative ABC transport system permease protein